MMKIDFGKRKCVHGIKDDVFALQEYNLSRLFWEKETGKRKTKEWKRKNGTLKRQVLIKTNKKFRVIKHITASKNSCIQYTSEQLVDS